MKEYSFNIENDINKVKHLLEDIEKTGFENDISEECINSIVLAIDEILTNIISYAFSDFKIHIINIVISYSDEIKVIITDDGQQFNPLSVTVSDISSDIEKRTVGGLGIHLVKAIVDKMDYKFENNKNVLSLIKYKKKECN